MIEAISRMLEGMRHVAVGAAENERAVKIHDAWQMGNMSMAAWRLG